MNTTTWICLDKYERLVKKDHKIRAGIEPTSSDNRSDILPLNYPIFSLALNINYIFEHSSRRLDLPGQRWFRSTYLSSYCRMRTSLLLMYVQNLPKQQNRTSIHDNLIIMTLELLLHLPAACSFLERKPSLVIIPFLLSFLFEWLWILFVSLQFLFNRWLLLLIAGLKLKNSLTK